MLTSLTHFLQMEGYGYYIWSAYGSVALLLGIHWFIPWYRCRRIDDTEIHE